LHLDAETMLGSIRYRLRESGVNPELSRSGKQERKPQDNALVEEQPGSGGK